MINKHKRDLNMKVHSLLKSLLKKGILITMLLPTLPIFAAVSIEMGNNEIIVTTDEVGQEGYKGCQEGQLKLLSAYVYTLYKKEYSQNNLKNSTHQSCSAFKWVKIDEKKSNSPEEVFPNMTVGEYKATVYSGQAIGCSINGNTKNYPSRSIVYYQEKSNTFDLNDTSIDTNNVITSATNQGVLNVFPNPTSGEIQIQLKNHSLNKKANIVFYDLLGKEALRLNQDVNNNAFTEWQIDVSSFSGGAYVLRIFDQEGNSYERKVMVIENK